MNFKKSWKRANDGFTLVELIVVIAILAILAGIAVPAYSGYIKKANKAADMQVLAAVNTAFAAAALENGNDLNEVSDATLTSEGDGMTIKAIGNIRLAKGTADVTKYNESFERYMSGSTATMKVISISALDYVQGVGFVDPASSNGTHASVSYRGTTIYVNRDTLNTLVNSGIGDFGAKTLLQEVGGAVDWANENGIADLGGANYMNALKGYLGLKAEASEEDIRSAMMELADNDPTTASKISANSVALYAAQNSANLTTNSISAWFGQDTDAMESNPSANTLSEAAAIYGLYMSYKGEDFDTSDTVLDVMAGALSDKDFANWVNDPNSNAQAELEAYKAAMSIIDDAAADDTTRGSLLTNGFADSELIGVMQGLMGK